MPVKPFVGQEEPPLDAPIWRYMDLEKFHDLLASEELYFRRMDKFKNDDPHEGLPPNDFVRKIRRLRRYDLRDEQTLNNTQAVNRQFSEGHYIQCWNLHEGEKLEMWRGYAPCGVAVASRYELLRAVLDAQIDEFHLGLVHYGKDTRQRDNVLENAFHKDYRFESERCFGCPTCSSLIIGTSMRTTFHIGSRWTMCTRCRSGYRISSGGE